MFSMHFTLTDPKADNIGLAEGNKIFLTRPAAHPVHYKLHTLYNTHGTTCTIHTAHFVKYRLHIAVHNLYN